MLRYHVVEVEFINLPSGVHNVTAVLTTQEKLRFIRPISSALFPPTSSCKNGEITVTTMIDGD